MYSPGLGFCRVDWPSEPLSVPPGAQYGTRLIENDDVSWQPGLRMVENYIKLLILNVPWQPGLRMIENDTKLIDLSVSWQPGLAGLRMLESDTKLIDFERLLAAWGQNGGK